MNSFLNGMINDANYKTTENGGVALKSTRSMVLDMFALGGAYRSRPNDDCILLFKNAFEENADLALKCLFYLRDIRGGQGERRFFRVCYKWLANNYPDIARKNLENVSEYGRYDDLIYACLGTKIESDMLALIKHQLSLDVDCKTPSLMAKWIPSENVSSQTTKAAAKVIREYLGMTHKQYRKTLSVLRERINVLERLMSAGRWQDIEFDKIPSRAGLIYKNAFSRRDIIAKKYEAFAKDTSTKVNAEALYPYECVSQVVDKIGYFGSLDDNMSDVDRAMAEKYWNNLPDYFNGKQSNMLCVVDTSSSMVSSNASAPINVAISLGMYAAERAGGPFKNHYISFSRDPKLIKIEGVDFADKVYRICRTNLCENTNLVKTFDMLLSIADRPDVKEEDIPETIVVISDMEIDQGSGGWWLEKTAMTEMDKVRAKWAAHGHKLPRLVYWCVNSRNTNTILDAGPTVSFVSGMSPSIFESIITGKNGYELMINKLVDSGRYNKIHA